MINKIKGVFSDDSVSMFWVMHWCDVTLTKFIKIMLRVHKWSEKKVIWLEMLECVFSQQERRQRSFETVNKWKMEELKLCW
jgi:hypothetical protein